MTSLPSLARDGLRLSRRGFFRLASSKLTWLAAGAGVGIAGYGAHKLQRSWSWTKDPRVGASLHGFRPFPDDNPWNRDVSQDPVDPLSDLLIASMAPDKSLRIDCGFSWRYGWMGMPYLFVPASQPPVPVVLGSYAHESDKGPFKIPLDAPIEGGPNSTGDRHVIVVDSDWMLYELFNARTDGVSWFAESAAIFDLNSNDLRPAGWTSADAAGLPIFPGLLRYDELRETGRISHALRFTMDYSRKAYVPPARHWASAQTDPRFPPMGMRVRLKGNFDISGFSHDMQIILKGLKTYGMLLADNGGDWFVTGAHHNDWNQSDLKTLKRVKGSDFEVVKMTGLVEG